MNLDSDKIFTFLGFAQKAGKVASGENTVEAELAKKKARLLLIAEDAPEHTKIKFKRLAQRCQLRYVIFGEQNRLGQAIGKSPRNVVLISDKNFAEQILLLIA